MQKQTELTAAFEDFTQKEMRLVELYEEGIIDMDLYRQRRGHLDKQKLSVAAELADIESRLPDEKLAQIDIPAVVQKFKHLRETFGTLDLHEKQRFLQAVISEFRAFPDGRLELDLNLMDGLCDSPVPINQFQHIDLNASRLKRPAS